MTVKEILKKYSKEVIIEWVTNKYLLFLNENLEEELEDVHNNLEFDKANKELKILFKKQKELDKKPFSVDVAIEWEKNQKRIRYLLDKQEKFIN